MICQKTFKVKNTKQDIKIFINGFLADEIGELTPCQKFRIKLILMELFANAYIHGNLTEDHKEITMGYSYEHPELCIEVSDEGEGYLKTDQTPNADSSAADKLYLESGKGLDLVGDLAEEIVLSKSGSQIWVRLNLKKLEDLLDTSCSQ